jgi:hypothetical protein
MMKLKAIIILLLISNSLLAMQPTQWLRDAQQKMEAEDKLIQATEQAQQKIKKMHQETLLASAQEATSQLEEKVKDGTLFSYYRQEQPEYAAWLYNEIKKLLDLGADPNVSFHGGTILESRPPQIPFISLLEMTIPKYPRITELLLSYGARPLGLYKAIKNNSETIVRLLIDSGVNPNESLRDKTRVEVINKDTGEVKYTRLGYHYNISSSPLELAIQEINLAMFSLLIDLGADPDYIIKAEFPGDYQRTKSARQLLLDNIKNVQNAQDRATYQEMLDSLTMTKKLN